jgi:hypothetical protein
MREAGQALVRGTGQKNFAPGDDGTEVAALTAVVQRRVVSTFRDGTEKYRDKPGCARP